MQLGDDATILIASQLINFSIKSLIESVLIFGNPIEDNTLKCLSSVTIYWAPAAIAQSQYLLSSGSASIRPHL